MSFLYPRTITVNRYAVTQATGVVGYNGETDSELTPILEKIPASIQLAAKGSAPPTKLPGDPSKRVYWNILFKADLGTVQTDDVIVDELGNRYQVVGPYWNSLGYQCLCELLEA